jgi:hypothetical protein
MYLNESFTFLCMYNNKKQNIHVSSRHITFPLTHYSPSNFCSLPKFLIRTEHRKKTKQKIILSAKKMESLLFDENCHMLNEPNPDFDLLFSQLDAFDVDFNRLEEEDSSSPTPSSSVSAYSPSNQINEESSSQEAAVNRLSLFKFDTNDQFSFMTMLTQQACSEAASVDSVNESSSYTNSSIPRRSIQVSPISICLPERENNGMKVASEIILNFEPMNTDSVTQSDLQFLEMLSQSTGQLVRESEGDYAVEQLSILSNSPTTDTCIDLVQEEDEDSNDSSGEDSINVNIYEKKILSGSNLLIFDFFCCCKDARVSDDTYRGRKGRVQERGLQAADSFAAHQERGESSQANQAEN